MKRKIFSIALGLIMLSGSLAFAEPDAKAGQTGGDDGFAARKAQRIKNLNDEKAGLDQVITCMNSAKNRDDTQRCNEINKANRNKIHDRKIAARKEHLRGELQKLDSQSANTTKK